MRRLICAETRRAMKMLEEGRPLTHSLPYKLGRNIEVIVRGGLAIGEKILSLDGEVLHARPRVSRWQKFTIAVEYLVGFSKLAEPLTQTVPG